MFALNIYPLQSCVYSQQQGLSPFGNAPWHRLKVRLTLILRWHPGTHGSHLNLPQRAPETMETATSDVDQAYLAQLNDGKSR